MELKRRISLEKIFICTYFCALFIYIIIGFMPARAAMMKIDGHIIIPGINLYTNVTKLEVKNSELKTPDQIAGSFYTDPNRTLLIGHSVGVFSNLSKVKPLDKIIYNDRIYTIYNIYTAEKNKINMEQLLKPNDNKTIVLMTCAGEQINNEDYTHRLIIEAKSV